MTLEFEIIDSAAATATIKENAFVTMLGETKSPFIDLELGKSIKFDVPASTPEEIKDAEKLKKDLGDHIRLVRPDFSPLVRTRDEHGKRHFVATIQKQIKRDRKPAENGNAATDKPAGKPAPKTPAKPAGK